MTMQTQLHTPAAAGAAYAGWLERQPLAINTRRAYRVQVAQYCTYLAASLQEAGDPLHEHHAATYAVRDYRIWLKTVRKAKPSSVNRP